MSLELYSTLTRCIFFQTLLCTLASARFVLHRRTRGERGSRRGAVHKEGPLCVWNAGYDTTTKRVYIEYEETQTISQYNKKKKPSKKKAKERNISENKFEEKLKKNKTFFRK